VPKQQVAIKRASLPNSKNSENCLLQISNYHKVTTLSKTQAAENQNCLTFKER